MSAATGFSAPEVSGAKPGAAVKPGVGAKASAAAKAAEAIPAAAAIDAATGATTGAATGTPGPSRPLPPHVLRHTRMVSAMRLLLPSVAALVLGALALWSQLGVDGDRFLLSMGALGPRKIDSMNMSNPRYEGIDEKKRPFIVTAKQATQVDKKGEVIDLAAPQADITLENGAWLSLNAEGGQFQRTAQLLELTGAVNIFHDQGYEMHTRDMHVDLASGRATGHKPVQGQGPAGDLTAEGIDVSEGGKRVLLLGRSHVVLYGTDQVSSPVPAP